MIKYCSREEKLPIFSKERIVLALSENDNPFEMVDEDKIEFERVFAAGKIENKAWI